MILISKSLLELPSFQMDRDERTAATYPFQSGHHLWTATFVIRDGQPRLTYPKARALKDGHPSPPEPDRIDVVALDEKDDQIGVFNDSMARHR